MALETRPLSYVYFTKKNTEMHDIFFLTSSKYELEDELVIYSLWWVTGKCDPINEQEPTRWLIRNKFQFVCLLICCYFRTCREYVTYLNTFKKAQKPFSLNIHLTNSNHLSFKMFINKVKIYLEMTLL